MSDRDSEEDGNELQGYLNLITLNQWALRGFILSLMPGSSDVDDVLQETNLVLWEKRKKFTLGTDFLAWATTIARFQVMRHRGLSKKSHAVSISDDFINDLAERMAPDDSKTPLLNALDRCLEGLSQKHRQLLLVRYTPNYSLVKYSEKLGTSPEVLRVTLHRVRQVLRRCIDKAVEDPAK